jgi:2-hydroxychromene-2-carboxylate isomerase
MGDMAKLEFHYDFGSPNAYLAWRVLPQLAERTGAELVHFPVLLGGLFKLTGNRSPAETLVGIKNKPEYERLETERFVRRHGLSEFRMNPHFPVNTLQLMRGAIAAERLGLAEPYRAAIYAAMWEDGRKLDDPEVLKATLTGAGLPAEALAAESQTDAVKQQLIKNTEESFRRGAFGSPTFFVGDEIFFGKDRLRDVEDELGRVRAAA